MLSALAADRARVADLDAQILDLEHSLSALRYQKQLVQERLGSYSYPVLTLPNEIVAEIFIHFLPLYPLCPPLTGRSSPTILTQICQKWREIALATPKLWRAISLTADIDLEQRLHMCHAWLTRSCSCPLSIRGLDAPQLLEAVIPCRARWEYLDLTLFPAYLPAFEGPMPLLRHLDLAASDEDITVTIPAAPLLLSITLDFFNAVTPTIILPLAQLTSLTLQYVYRNEYVAMLRHTFKLVHCELGILYQHNEPLEHDIELPCLESLVLLAGTIHTMRHLHDFLVPALRSLRVEEVFLQPEPIAALSSFISKSRCKLQELRITGAKIPLGSYLEAFPSTEVSFET
jgi:hypothetical protein